MEEKELYPKVIKWFKEFLSGKLRGIEFHIFNSSQEYLSEIIKKNNFTSFFPYYATYQVKIDITSIIIKDNIGYLAIIECKTRQISVKDFAQILGYAKILNPILAIILSPQKLSLPLYKLLAVYQREEILEYSNNRKVVIAAWDISSNNIPLSEIIPLGYLASFNQSFLK